MAPRNDETAPRSINTGGPSISVIIGPYANEGSVLRPRLPRDRHGGGRELRCTSSRGDREPASSHGHGRYRAPHRGSPDRSRTGRRDERRRPRTRPASNRPPSRSAASTARPVSARAEPEPPLVARRRTSGTRSRLGLDAPGRGSSRGRVSRSHPGAPPRRRS